MMIYTNNILLLIANLHIVVYVCLLRIPGLIINTMESSKSINNNRNNHVQFTF